MAQSLNGSELVDFIMERQARQVRALRQAHKIFPKLVILKSDTSSPVIDTYIRMKQRYGSEILVDSAVETCRDDAMAARIEQLNADETVHGIIVQLPLQDPSKTDNIVAAIAPSKDVDGLGPVASYDSATASAINWLLAGYSVDLKGKKIAIVGNGRLVGTPLAKMWEASGFDVTVLDETSKDIASVLKTSDIIVTATGVPRLITSDMVPIDAVVVDAGTASENGVIVGDVDDEVRTRDDIKITPVRGGVGPLTIALLFDHVIRAAQTTAAR